MKVKNIAFIGFGEAGRAFAASLALGGGVKLRAHDILWDGTAPSEMRAAAENAGVMLCPTPQEAVEGADIVISAVTAGSAATAIGPITGAGDAPVTLWDINSVTPALKAANAARVRGNGGRYLDMAVMAPVHPRGHKTPVLVAGDMEGSRPALDALGFDYDVAGDAPGDAAVVKMVRSLFVKGLEALTVQTMTAAARAGCEARVLASLAASFPGLTLESSVPYQFERVGTHGIRRADEMDAVAETYGDLGLAQGQALAAAISAIQRHGAGRIGGGEDALACARQAAEALTLTQTSGRAGTAASAHNGTGPP